MNDFRKLLDQCHPKGVPYKLLSEICDISPSGVDKKIKDGEHPVRLCNYTDVYNNIYITQALAEGFMKGSVSDKELAKFQLRRGQVIITKDSESHEDIAQSACVKTDLDTVVCGYHLALLKPHGGLDGEYLNYALRSVEMKKYFSSRANGVTRYSLTLDVIQNTPIPIPSMDVQHEIVKILDSFTQLEAELATKLEAELEARRKQYEYYRNELLDFQ